MSEPLLSVRDLRVVFRMATGEIEALHGVDFDIEPGSTVALVGESGSGKSVTAQAVMGILPANARITSGQLIYKDPVSDTRIDIATLDPDSPELQAIRGGRISIIFQEPMVSLSPLHTVGDQVSEALFLHHDVNRAQGIEQTEAMLEMVGFPDPARALRTYPFELSGGLRQRAMIAMALVCRPSLLIADEPTGNLDPDLSLEVMRIFRRFNEVGVTLLIASHDIALIDQLGCRRIALEKGTLQIEQEEDIVSEYMERLEAEQEGGL